MPGEEQHIDQILIKIGGKDLPTEMMDLLYFAEVENTLYLPSMFTLRFYDDDFEMMDSDLIMLAAEIEIWMGRGADAEIKCVFKGEITALEPEFNEDSVALFVVRGYDIRHRLTKTHTQTFVKMTDSDIVTKLIQAVGIPTGKVDSTPIVRDHLFQDNLSDLAIIQMLALRNGFELAVNEAGKLNFCLVAPKPLVLELKWRTNLRSFRPRLTLAQQVKEVEVRSWDRKQKRLIVAVGMPSSSVPKIGAANMASKDKTYPTSKFIEGRVPVVNQKDAERLSKALAAQIGSSFAEAEGLALGDPDLMPGVSVKIADIGKRFGGEYTVSSTRHMYLGTGYDTQFTVEGTQPQQVADLVAGTTRRSSQWQGAIPALVTDNLDPEKMNRVKVKFPTLTEDHTSEWAPVVAVGAGANRGIEWLPEVNDEVLVLFEAGDINHPYVIGAMWNGKDSPVEPQASSNGKISIRTMKSRVGHVLRMIDEDKGALKKGIQIVDGTGQYKIIIDTTTGKITIVSAGEIAIEAATNLSLSARANVEIKGLNVNVQAQTQLNLQGATTANLKGGIVNIN